jgi:hypothetical protein
MRLTLPMAGRCAGLLAVLLLAAGCIIAVGHDKRPSQHMSQPTAHGPHCADIEIARSIDFSAQRNQALAKIAALPDLTEHEQIFLVDSATISDGFSADKTAVLVALAQNPALTQKARERIAMRIGQADLFSSDVERISQALLPG